MYPQKPASKESSGESISRFLRDGFQKYTALLVEITWSRFWLLAFLTLVGGGILDDILPSKRSYELEAAVQILSQVVAAGKERSAEIPWTRLEMPASIGHNLAWIFVIGSAVIKLSARGRVEAEAAATAATETAERESLKRQVAEARMATMEAQVEPHFLFNTLASIDHLIETDPASASRMQKHFIAFLRATLPSLRNTAPSSLQPLGRELEIIEPYLELFRIRMGDRLQTRIEVPAELQRAAFPPMMLQSLVENAIKHGLEPRPEGGELRITARSENDFLILQVTDTGLSFGASPVGGNGIGLKNIEERLRLLFGDRALLQITSPPDGGACVTLRMPHSIL
jgi:signal transduction histidine kinase